MFRKKPCILPYSDIFFSFSYDLPTFFSFVFISFVLKRLIILTSTLSRIAKLKPSLTSEDRLLLLTPSLTDKSLLKIEPLSVSDGEMLGMLLILIQMAFISIESSLLVKKIKINNSFETIIIAKSDSHT